MLEGLAVCVFGLRAAEPQGLGLRRSGREASHSFLSVGYFPFVPSSHPQSGSQPWKFALGTVSPSLSQPLVSG